MMNKHEGMTPDEETQMENTPKKDTEEKSSDDINSSEHESKSADTPAEDELGPMAGQLENLKERMEADAVEIADERKDGLAKELEGDAVIERMSGGNRETWETVVGAAESGQWDVVAKKLPDLTATSLDNELLLAMTSRLRAIAEKQENLPQAKRFARAEAEDLRELGRTEESDELLSEHFTPDEIEKINSAREANERANARRERDVANEHAQKVADAKEKMREERANSAEEDVDLSEADDAATKEADDVEAASSDLDSTDAETGIKPFAEKETAKEGTVEETGSSIELHEGTNETEDSEHKLALRDEAEGGGPKGPEDPNGAGAIEAGEPNENPVEEEVSDSEEEGASFWNNIGDAMKAGSFALWAAGMDSARRAAGNKKGIIGKTASVGALIALAPFALGIWLSYKMLKWIGQRGPELISKYTGAKIPQWVKEANGTAGKGNHSAKR